MGKISDDDKMRIQTLRELGFGYRKIRAKFPDKNLKIGTVQSICRRVDERGSAVKRKSGSGRPRNVRTKENVEKVAELICSQDEPGSTFRNPTLVRRIGGATRLCILMSAHVTLFR